MKKNFVALLLALGCVVVYGESLNLTDLGTNGIPKGWKQYGKNGVCKVEGDALRITDKDVKSEWGITRAMPISGPGKYAFSIDISVPEGGNVNGNVKGMLMTIDAEKKRSYAFVPFKTAQTGKFTRMSGVLEVKDPAIKNILLYVYSSYAENCDYLVRNADFSKVDK